MRLVFKVPCVGVALPDRATRRVMNSVAAGIVVAACLAPVAPMPTSAATLRVPSEYATIQAALGVAGVADCGGSAVEHHRAVSFASSETRGAVVDGFTIRNGWHLDGGAIHIIGASPTIRNCILEDNVAEYSYGGGLYCYDSPLIQDCIMRRNVAGSRGGGVYSGGDALIERCWIVDNEAEDGGGIHCRQGTNVIGCAVLRNRATRGYACGGGISCRYHTGVISGCTLVGNAAQSGARVAFYGDGPTVERCIVFGCVGAGAYGWGYGGANSTPTIRCCDTWNNLDGTGNALLPGMIDGGENFSEDPLFCDGAADDYTLSALSGCLPAGHPACGLIGAYGQGCGITAVGGSVESRSWGSLKSLYR